MIILLSTVFFCFLFSLVSIYTTNKNKYESVDRSRFLEVVNSDEEVVGYLIGSVHAGLEEKELEKTIRVVGSLLSAVKHVYLECITGHWSHMPMGAEKVVLRSVENEYPDVEVGELETLVSQRAMLAGVFSVGKNTYRLHFGSVFLKLPVICTIIAGFVKLIWLLPNLVYIYLINPEYNAEYIKTQNKRLADIRKAYINDEVGFVSSEEVNLYQLFIRDREMYKTICKKVGEFSKDHKFLVLVGMFHLAYDKGLVSYFEKDGYTIRPMDLSSEEAK